MDAKECRSCSVKKPAQYFYRNATNHDGGAFTVGLLSGTGEEKVMKLLCTTGLYNMCKACFAEKNRCRRGVQEDTRAAGRDPAARVEGPYIYEESLSSFPGVAK